MLQATPSVQTSSQTWESLSPVGTDQDEWARYEQSQGRPGIISDDDAADLNYLGLGSD